MHHLDLKAGADADAFEAVVRRETADLMAQMPGLLERRFLRGYKGARQGRHAMLWIFASQAALEALFGTGEEPLPGPAAFVRYEQAIGPFLSAPRADAIEFTDYLEIDEHS